MSKKGKRLREYEKNNRVYNTVDSERERRERRDSRKRAKEKEKLFSFADSPKEVVVKTVRKNKVTNLSRFAVFVLLVIFVIVIAFSTIKIIKLSHERATLEKYNKELLIQKEDLEEQFKSISSKEFLEQQIRKRLRMIKENEILFVIPDEEESENEKADGE